MRNHHRMVICPLSVIVLAVAATALLPGQNPAGISRPAPGSSQAAPQTAHTPSGPLASYLKLPLRFEANRGQADQRVHFISRGLGYTLFLTSREAVLVLANPVAKQETPRERLQAEAAASPRTPPAVVRLALTGANRRPAITEQDPLPTKSNYFIGNDPSKWRTNVPNYAQVRYREVYPDIDLIYYGNQRRLEHDFVVAPGADPSRITFALRGVSKLRIDGGDLVMNTAQGELRLLKPEIYQSLDGSRHSISGGYVLKGGNRVGFAVAEYDRRRPLVIDPVLSYSTFLGGDYDDQGYGIAVDSGGNAYVTGVTFSADFPVTSGAFQSTLLANIDGCSNGEKVVDSGQGNAFVTKLNSTGTALVYSTYVGGTCADAANAIAVDSSGNAYITGITGSTNFPTTSGAFQTSKASTHFNAFVTKLNSTGTALLYSTYLGGNVVDEANAIAVDSSDYAYVTGDTYSTNFPTTSGAFQTSIANSDDNPSAFVTKLNSTGTALLYSTYLGGNVAEDGYGIAVDSSDNAYVTGVTGSTNFPTTSGAFQTTLGTSNGNAFVTKLNSTGTALLYSTYLGGNVGDNGNAIAVDSGGNAYVTGLTSSTDFPITSGAFQTTLAGTGNAFVTKLNSTGTALLYSTYLGGIGGAAGNGIALDSSGNAYVAGATSSTVFPTTSGAIQTTLGNINGYPNAFVTELNSTGTTLVYSTYLGGSGNASANYGDVAFGIALDSSGNAYVTGNTASANFPVTSGAFQTVLSPLGNSGKLYDAFVAKIVSSNLTNQTIIVTTGAPASADDGSSFMVAATASSGLSVSIEASGACTGSGTGSASIIMTAATGTCTVTYTQAGNSTYAAAPTVTSMTTATAATLTDQTIMVTTAAPASAADGSTFPVAATVSSGLPVSIAASGACIGSGTDSATITMTAATGTCTVTYTQAGNSTYAAAPTVTSMTTATAATLASQTITVTTAAPASAADNSTFMVSATASSGLPVSIAASGACSGSGTGSATITMTASTGTCTVTYTQAGNSTYAAAPTVTSATAATLASQSITVTTAAPASAADNSTFMVSATASSGLPVSIAASGACSGSGTGSATITMTASTGTCTVTYTQAGNSTYAAAPTVASMTTATSAAPAPTFTLSSPTGAQTAQPGASAQYSIIATAQNGTFSGSVNFTASGLPTGATAMFNPSSITPGNSSASTQLTIQTPALARAEPARDPRWPLAVPALALVSFFFLPGKRRRRWISMVLLLIVSLGAFTALSACGGGFGLVTSAPATSYNITVTGTSGAVVQTTTVQLTIE